MLHKDQYNQDEYNDYYRQEVEGAEINGEEEGSGKKSIFMLLLSFLILGVGGYFGFKMYKESNAEKNNETITITQDEQVEVKEENKVASTEKTTTNKQAIEEPEKPKIVSIQEADNIEETEELKEIAQVSSEVEKVLKPSDSKMSPEDIAKVVQMVMMQMGQNKETETTSDQNSSSPSSTTNKDEKDLLNALSESTVDAIKEEKPVDYTNAESNKNKEIESSDKKIDTYNKVTIQTTSGTDELSRLSEQISNVIDSTSTTSSTSSAKSNDNYTQSITKEVRTRSNAMRIIIVRKGDTLGKISQRAYGNVTEFKKIYDANPDIINRPDRIYVGQKLRIPQ